MSFLRELFSDDKTGKASNQRFNNTVGVAVGSLVIGYLTLHDKLTEGIFALYILATGGVYGFGKFSDSRVDIERARAENPQPLPLIPAPAPNTLIQMGSQKGGDLTAKDVNMDVAGDVRVNKKGKK